MKKLIAPFILTFLLFSCNNVDTVNTNNSNKQEIKQITSKTEEQKTTVQEILVDSVNDLTIGDCFILKKTNSNKGLILTKMAKGSGIVYDFTLVKLDSSKKGINKFIHGNIRMVPIATMTGVVEDWGTQCVGLMGQDDVKKFLNSFSKVGKIKFKNKAPLVSSSSFLMEYNPGELNGFCKENEMMWTNQNKTENLNTLVEIK